ncbi:MAG: diguanylate cyclase [Gammaproteobacteria bacterium]|nr:diguanylate cyclase [Gammaproteobacteria bacterium]
MQYIENTYNIPLVSLSIAISILAAYIAIEFSGTAWRVNNHTHKKRWLSLSALSFGLGIWSMHTIGMFAYKLPIEVYYEVGLTLLSFLIAISSCYVSFYVTDIKHTKIYVSIGSLIMGLGITSMHYLGLEAMHIHATMHHDPVQVLIATTIAIVSSWFALWLLVTMRTGKATETTFRKLAIASILGIAVSGMHYSGMAKMTLTYSASSINHTEHMMMSNAFLLTATALMALTLLILPLVLVVQSRKKEILLSAETITLRANEERLRILIEGAPDAFYVHDLNGKILDVNKAACDSLGYSRDELLHLSVFTIEVGLDENRLTNEIWPQLKSGSHHTLHGRHLRKDGSQFPVEVNITCITDKNDTLILALARDTTELEQLKSHLHTLAMTDELTNIYNRRAFMECSDQEFSRCARVGSILSTLLIDLDYFKSVNDTYGHQAGDLVLQKFSRLVKSVLRNGDLFGRVGGEEFSVLLPNTNEDAALILAERILEKIENTPIKVKDNSINITVSIGVATLTNTMTINDLFHNADTALYQAKKTGRNKFVAYRQNYSANHE